VGSYGRNFEFRVPPMHGQRGARYALPPDAAADLPIGVPVVVADGADADDMGLLPVALATGAQAPKPGLAGIVVYEHAPAAYAGDDPFLTTFSDKDTVPRGKACQVVAGDRVKVVFRNTEDRTFLTVRQYEGRTMVAGMGATPTVAVGDYLTPGAGNDTAGYWTETANAAQAWLVVERVDPDRGEVEARMAF
jgi:hypothetical protein